MSQIKIWALIFSTPKYIWGAPGSHCPATTDLTIRYCVFSTLPFLQLVFFVTEYNILSFVRTPSDRLNLIAFPEFVLTGILSNKKGFNGDKKRVPIDQNLVSTVFVLTRVYCITDMCTALQYMKFRYVSSHDPHLA